MKIPETRITTLHLLLALTALNLSAPLLAQSVLEKEDAMALEREARDPNTNLHSLIVEHGGRIELEIYRQGRDKTIDSSGGLGTFFSSCVEFDGDKLHDVRSVTKSITSLLWGIPAYQKRLADLDSSVASLYPEIPDLGESDGSPDLRAAKRRITVRNLFQMNSGLAWEEWGNPLASDELRLLWKPSHVRFLMDRPQVSEPGAQFNYNGGSTAVLADLLVRAAGKGLIDIAREDLFEPLGIQDFQWALDFRGRPLPHAGLRLRPRDMVKIGRLVLNGGVWNGKQIIRRDWIETSTRRHLDTGVTLLGANEESLGYGYQWWTGSSLVKGRHVAWSAAVGNGGQRIFVVPELDLVVVTTAGDYGEVQIQRKVTRLFEKVLQAIR